MREPARPWAQEQPQEQVLRRVRLLGAQAGDNTAGSPEAPCEEDT